MKADTAHADDGWRWYVCGWKLFKKSPGVLIGQLLLLLVIAIVAGVIPVVGSLAMALLSPVFAAGLYYSVRELDNDNTIDFGHLFQGFQNKGRIGSLIVLGGVLLAMQIILGIVVATLLGAGSMAGISIANAGAMIPGLGALLALGIITLLAALVFTAMFYAIPLVIFQASAPIEALKTSFWTTLHHWLALLVFGLVYLVFAIIAAIPAGLGFIVLMPVSLCAAYCSYKTLLE